MFSFAANIFLMVELTQNCWESKSKASHRAGRRL